MEYEKPQFLFDIPCFGVVRTNLEAHFCLEIGISLQFACVSFNASKPAKPRSSFRSLILRKIQSFSEKVELILSDMIVLAQQPLCHTLRL